MPDNEDQNEEEEEIEEEEETEVLDNRLQKSVNFLIKITKIDKEKLKGLTLEEQFDRLDFLADNMPEATKTVKKKNKPVVPKPVDIDAPTFGKVNKNLPKGILFSASYSPIEVFKKSTTKK